MTIKETITFNLDNETEQKTFRLVIGLRLLRDEFKRNAIGSNAPKFLGRADLVNNASHEIENLRNILGNLIDKWEMMPNDLRGSVEDSASGFYAAMTKLAKEGVK